MFKMGCSMARKILAIDGKGSSQASSSSASAAAVANTTAAATAAAGGGASSSSSDTKRADGKKQSKENHASGAGKQGEELNDFSKLEDDPRLPLNVRQIFKITKSWKAIARTMSKTGTAMFLNLFEQNQDLFYLFDRFQHLKGKELHESMELREHAATVMSTLDQSINSLSDYDNFVTYLHSIGKLHRKVPGFKREHFWKIEHPFLKAVKQTLDERCNETIEEIYKIAIKLIIETISEGYGEDQPDVEGSLREVSGQNGNGGGDKSSGAGGGHSDASGRSESGRHDEGGKQAGQMTRPVMGSDKGNAGSGRQQQQQRAHLPEQRASITGQSGEKYRQKPDENRPSAAAVSPETPTATADRPLASDESKQMCPISMEIGTRVNYDKKDSGCSKDKSGRELKDELKTTITCLRELLLVALKGASSDQQQQQQERDFVGCERLWDEDEEKTTNKNKRMDRNESESENKGARCAPGYGGSARVAIELNEWAASIGCGGGGRSSNANNKLHARANDEGSHHNSSCVGAAAANQKEDERGRLAGRLLFGFGHLFTSANTKRKSAALSSGSLSSEKRKEKRSAKKKKKEKKKLDGGESENERVQFNEHEDASREGEAVHLLSERDSGKLALFLNRLSDVVKREETSKVHNKDRKSESRKPPAQLCPQDARGGTHWLAAVQSPRNPPTVAGGSVADNAASGCVRQRNNNNIRSLRERRRKVVEECSRSVCDKTTVMTADGGVAELTITSQSLLPLPLHPNCCSTPSSSSGSRQSQRQQPLNDRYSNRPCNETSSQQARELTSGAVQLDGPTQATGMANPAKAPALDMDSRDHYNDRDNLADGGASLASPGAAAAAAHSDGDGVDGRKISHGDHHCGRGQSRNTIDDKRVCLSCAQRFEIKQSSPTAAAAAASEGFIRSRIILPLLRGHKFAPRSERGSQSPESGLEARPRAPSRRAPKVNENEDLVLLDGRKGRVSLCEGHNHQPVVEAHIGDISQQTQFARSGRPGEQERPRRTLSIPIRQSSSVPQPAATTTTTTRTTTITSIEATRLRPADHNKQTQSRKQTMRAAQKATNSSTWLTSNAGDLGELIKMLMFTLLTSSNSGGDDGDCTQSTNSRRQLAQTTQPMAHHQ